MYIYTESETEEKKLYGKINVDSELSAKPHTPVCDKNLWVFAKQPKSEARRILLPIKYYKFWVGTKMHNRLDIQNIHI